MNATPFLRIAAAIFVVAATIPLRPAPAAERAPTAVLVGVQASALRGSGSPIDALIAVVRAASAERLFTAAPHRIDARSIDAPRTVVYRVALPAGADPYAAIAALQANGAVFAEPDHQARALAVPDDPLFAEQWGLGKINVAAAWDVITGTPGTIVAVVDSGIDFTHPDLAARLWTNPGEIADNDVDDDNNGYVDDVHGWNFVEENADASDVSGHGTQVAGVAAAAGNDNFGITGVCWNCSIMPLRVVQANGAANYSDIAAAVSYAAAKGAHVILIALGGRSDSAALRLAVANAADAVIVAAAGNDGAAQPIFPAAYDSVLAVTAATRDDARWSPSNFGDWVDLSAPGEGIHAPLLGGGWAEASGTSMAAPHVAGVAALVRALRPHFSPAQVRGQLIATARQPAIGALPGRGIPDAGAAVGAPRPLLSRRTALVDGVADGRLGIGASATLTVELANDGFDAAGLTVEVVSNHPAVTITGTPILLDALPAGQVRQVGPFVLDVADSVGFASVVSLTLQVRAADGEFAADFPITLATRSSEVEVCGALPDAAVWTPVHTWIVTCTARIDAGRTLFIAPGATIQFAPGAALDVRGVLSAAGTAEQPIVFESLDEAWDGLSFHGDEASGSALLHARVRGAAVGVRCSGAAPRLRHIMVERGGVQCDAGNELSAAGRRLRTTRIDAHGAFNRFALADADGDGDLDLAVLRSGVRIEVLHNDGAGRFGDRSIVAEGGFWAALAWGDFDSDGRLDLFAAAYGAPHVVFLRRNDGYTSREVGTSPGTSGVAVADSDRDGDADILVGSLSGSNTLFRNNGAATFSAVPVATTEDRTTAVALADLNGDARPDVIVANDSEFFGRASRWFPNTSGESSAPIYINGTRRNDRDLALADIDGDGDLDAALVSRWWTSAVLLNSGSGQFMVHTVFGSRNWYDSVDSVDWGDFEGDGDLDLAVAYAYRRGEVLLNDGAGRFTLGLPFAADANGAFDVTWADLDADGDLDLLTGADSDAATVQWNETVAALELSDSVITGNVIISGNAVVSQTAVHGAMNMTGAAHLTEVRVLNGDLRAGDDSTLERVRIFGGGMVVGAHAVVSASEALGAAGYGLETGADALVVGARLVGNGAGAFVQSGRITGSLFAANAGAGLQIGDGEVMASTFVDNGECAVQVIGSSVKISDTSLVRSGAYDLIVNSAPGAIVDASGNWWGDGVPTPRILDGRVDAARAIASSDPPRSAPDANAPAYVRSVSLQPDDVVGIETLRVDVHFSRPMDQDASVRFLSSEDFPADGFYDAAWMSSERFTASYDVSVQVRRGAHTLRIAGAFGADGVEIAPDERTTFTIDYAETLTASAPPPSPRVALETSTDMTRLTLRWSSRIADVTAWRYAVGRAPGAADVVNWTQIAGSGARRPEAVIEVVRAGLRLDPRTNYYASVQARNAAGLWSPLGVGGSPLSARAYVPLIAR